jgi:proteic killer suppression protein
MIKKIRHKSLRALYEKGQSGGLNAGVPRIRRILTLLDAASELAGMDIPGLHLHSLKGDYDGFWSARVTDNWRIVWRFDEGDVTDVDLTDYH